MHRRRVEPGPATGEVHALRGPGFAGVQFHPESVLTLNGAAIVGGAGRSAAGVTSMFSERRPSRSRGRCGTVVSTIWPTASAVKYAWCEVTRTFGKVTRRARVSSSTASRDLSRKNSPASASYTSRPTPVKPALAELVDQRRGCR